MKTPKKPAPPKPLQLKKNLRTIQVLKIQEDDRKRREKLNGG